MRPRGPPARRRYSHRPRRSSPLSRSAQQLGAPGIGPSCRVLLSTTLGRASVIRESAVRLRSNSTVSDRRELYRAACGFASVLPRVRIRGRPTSLVTLEDWAEPVIDRPTLPFVGRERELALLRACLEKVQTGVPRVVLIE